MAITREQAFTARVFHVQLPGDKCRVWRRNGETKTWKRQPERYSVPVKYGLYSYDTITNYVGAQDHVHTAKDCPLRQRPATQ